MRASTPTWPKTITVAITGASGSRYGLRLIECLIRSGLRTFVLVSEAGRVVLETEAGIELPAEPARATQWLTERFSAKEAQVRVFGHQEWTAPVASGSNPPDAMVICPCSMGTLGRIAAGLSGSLIERAADVALKERRKLILVARETPLTSIHLENMLRLTQAGAVMMPASPGFYNSPSSIEDLVDFMVARVLNHLDVPHDLSRRWGES